jgi:hypothetical protein
MSRSTTEVVGVQLAGLLFAVIVLATICLASTAEPAELTGTVPLECRAADIFTPEAAVYYPAPDGTFEIGAYMALGAVCQTMSVCFGVPMTVPDLAGVEIQYCPVPALVACPWPAFETAEERSLRLREWGLEGPVPSRPDMRSEKSWTGMSSHR